MLDTPKPKEDGLRRYGSWAGNPEGRVEDTACCIAEIYDNTSRRFYQCSRKRGHGPGGLYCKQHVPEEVERRRLKAKKRDREKWNARLMEINGPLFYKVLKKIADGHNDPRTLAKEAIARFEP